MYVFGQRAVTEGSDLCSYDDLKGTIVTSHLLSAYYMPGTVLSALHVLSH